MHLILKLCTILRSKGGHKDFKFINISRFKAHTVVEDENWRKVLVTDVRFSIHSITVM